MTELRCVRGDQAWVIRAVNRQGHDIRHLLWQEVTVLWRAFPPYAVDKTGLRHGVHLNNPSWLVAFKKPERLPGKDATGRHGWCESLYAVFGDDALLPIRPEPDPEEDHYTEGLPACPEVV